MMTGAFTTSKMKCCFILLVVFSLLVLVHSTIEQDKLDNECECGNKLEEYETKYYWRDYYGTIPSDAVPVYSGSGENQKTMYIGSTYFSQDGILVSKIVKGDRFAYATARGLLLTSDKNTKILCSKDLSRAPSWHRINIQTVDTVHSNCNFIKGGTEVGYDLRIGKTVLNGETLFGKVFPKERPEYNGLEVWYFNRLNPKIQDFEMLGYC